MHWLPTDVLFGNRLIVDPLELTTINILLTRHVPEALQNTWHLKE